MIPLYVMNEIDEEYYLKNIKTPKCKDLFMTTIYGTHVYVPFAKHSLWFKRIQIWKHMIL
jgi:hypothetical protein